MKLKLPKQLLLSLLLALAPSYALTVDVPADGWKPNPGQQYPGWIRFSRADGLTHIINVNHDMTFKDIASVAKGDATNPQTEDYGSLIWSGSTSSTKTITIAGKSPTEKFALEFNNISLEASTDAGSLNGIRGSCIKTNHLILNDLTSLTITGCKISDPKHNIKFKGANMGGGALYIGNGEFKDVGNITLTHNSVESTEYDAAKGGIGALGGAINSFGTLIFSTQGSINISFNTAKTAGAAINGGAIAGFVSYFLESASLTFEGNSAVKTNVGVPIHAGGGALCLKKLIIDDIAGETLFKNNYTTDLGGAVVIYSYTFKDPADKSLILSAVGGDITFVGNTHLVSDWQNRASGVANAIYLFKDFSSAPAGENVALNAKAGRSVKFYDPITSNSTNYDSYTLDLNEGEGNTGMILFSGAKAAETLAGTEGTSDYAARLAASKVTDLVAHYVIHQGELRLEEGVSVGKKNDGATAKTGAKFTQKASSLVSILSGSTLAAELYVYEGGSMLVGAGSTLSTDAFDHKVATELEIKSAGGVINLGKFTTTDSTNVIKAYDKQTYNCSDINMMGGSSFDVNFMNASMPAIMTASGNLNLGGELILKDDRVDYLAPIWSHSREITLIDYTNGALLTGFDDFLTSTLPTGSVPGLGEWTMVDDGTRIKAVWTSLIGPVEETGRSYGGNVSNSMWSSASNVKSLSDASQSQANILRLESSQKRNFWMKGVGDFARHGNQAAVVGYKYSGAGYATGADYLVAPQTVVGLSFGQMMGTNHSEVFNARNNQNTQMGSLYMASLQKESMPRGQSILWSASMNYGNTSNRLRTVFHDGSSNEGKWNNTSYLLSGKAVWRITPKNSAWTYGPSLGLEASRVEMEGFRERGSNERRFSGGKYKNIALPVGVNLEHKSLLSDSMPWLNQVNVSYVPDVYRYNPRAKAGFVAKDIQWSDQGSKPSRSAVRVDVQSSLQLSPTWLLNTGYSFESRCDAIYHNVDLGVSYSF